MGALKRLQAMGYTEEDLEQSSPYNQWVKEIDVKVKTSELTGPALNWATAVAEDEVPQLIRLRAGFVVVETKTTRAEPFWYSPSTDWSQGGPIIERERIRTEYVGYDFPISPDKQWAAELDWYGPTPLIAAMRCYVANKLGDEVGVPEELLT